MPNHQKLHDWEALKSEWLLTDLSINKFRESKGIEKGLFYRSINIEDWWDKRSLISKKAATKIINKRADQLVRKYDDYYKLWNAIKAQAATILRKTQQNDGSIEPLSTYDLKNLTESLEKALKSERLLDGESTENVNNGIDVYNYILKVSQNVNGSGNREPDEQALEIEQPLQNQV